jgi:lauroyl/myristoyl acyltransferase
LFTRSCDVEALPGFVGHFFGDDLRGQGLFPSLPYYVYRLAGVVLQYIPPRLGYRLAEMSGALIYVLVPGVRRRVYDNVTHVLGGKAAAHRTARQALGNLMKNYYDLFRLPHLTLEESARHIEVKGWEHIEAGLSQGKGLIVASAHLGNIEIVVQIFALHNVPVTIPVERLQPPQLFDYVCRLRTSHGLRLLPLDRPLLELFRALRRGEVVGLAADRDVTVSGQIVDFFDAPARLPDGHVRMSLRTGAPLVCAFSERLPDNRFVAHILPPLNLAHTGDHEADVAAGMRQVVSAMERAIAQRPAQWYVTNAVWSSGESL